jgi:hypothetical protein
MQYGGGQSLNQPLKENKVLIHGKREVGPIKKG